MAASTSSSLSGRLWLAAIGCFLALAGVAFTAVLWRAWQRAEETRRWIATPCQIVSSRIVSNRPSPNANIEHRAEVNYRYNYQGQLLTGSRIRRVDPVTGHEDVARKRVEEFPVGRDTTCYVNPAQPEQAVLHHGSRAPLYSIWFPLLFVFGGLGMVWGAVKGGGNAAQA